MSSEKQVTLAITGASGAQYGLRLLECLVASGHRVALLISSAGRTVVNTETDIDLPEDAESQLALLSRLYAAGSGQIDILTKEDWFAPVASGSGAPHSMVICPASGGTLSAIATGASNNLIERAADVVIKERRKLIVVPRETPVSTIHLQNMLTLSKMGVVVLPASPGFYHQPQGLSDLVNFVVARILDQLGIDQALVKRWGSS